MIPKRMVSAVLERDGWVCCIQSSFCTGMATVADHRVGRGMGGNPALNVVHNLVAACGVCNGLRESDPDVAADCMSRGLKIRRSQSTQIDLARCLAIPIVYPNGDRWWLTPWGRSKVEEKPF